ncbi:hypothetical protein PT281_05555 [Lactobacillus sp. ESL0701]|uniref:hypothetical protein n=1 Tax=Lactobacillus sp. ESL0701 TaxID=2983217 RepID=UPI0023FA3C79|nr:hypothetical protein [Lactobacillus sp. ESL0701]MDF7672732.1 hypothetical protein [Lactobacillus sp. ESL0701]
MLYLIYILIGLLIILVVNLAVTACLTLKDIYQHRDQEQLTFTKAFKKYFIKNNNLPVSLNDWKMLLS